MTTQGLTFEQCLLIQSFHDAELDQQQEAEAEALVERSDAARVYLSALEELEAATRGAERAAWERVDGQMPEADRLVEIAIEAPDPIAADLDELAPLLERFHDDEVDHAELAYVQALLNERDDVADYLATLEDLSAGVQNAAGDLSQDVDFDGFWDGIAEEIGDAPDGETTVVESEEFRPGDHLVLLQRYFDGEVDADERAQVEAWLDDGHPEVTAYVEALEEIRVGVNAGIEIAQERTDLRDIWTHVAREIDAGDEGADVVSLDEARDEAQEDDDQRRATGSVTFFTEYKQAIFGAAAAVLLVAGAIALFGDKVFSTQEKVVVEKTVVIVDSVEYAPGSSVMVNSPMEQASLQPDKKGSQKPEEESSTVIWLLDNGNGDKNQDDGSAGGTTDESGEMNDTDAGNSGEAPAERPDTGEKPLGQPM